MMLGTTLTLGVVEKVEGLVVAAEGGRRRRIGEGWGVRAEGRGGEQQVTIIVSRTLKDKRQGEVQMEWTEGGRRRRGVRNETYRRGEPTTHPHSGTQDRQSSFQRFERCQHLPIPLSPNQHSLSMM